MSCIKKKDEKGGFEKKKKKLGSFALIKSFKLFKKSQNAKQHFQNDIILSNNIILASFPGLCVEEFLEETLFSQHFIYLSICYSYFWRWCILTFNDNYSLFMRRYCIISYWKRLSVSDVCTIRFHQEGNKGREFTNILHEQVPYPLDHHSTFG